MRKTPMRHPKRIFVAEDHFTIALALVDTLKHLGFEVVAQASNTAGAIETARTVEADCAILDINMGDGWSYDAAFVCRERGIPVVFTSGYDVPPEMPSALHDVPLLLKPVSVLEIEQTLHRVAESSY